MTRDATYWRNRLGLHPHPEGGFFRETYRAADELDRLPTRYSAPRAASTAIYFLLTQGTFSAFHRIRSDEAWHFYDGAPLVLHRLTPEGAHVAHTLGLDRGAAPQHVVPHGDWFAAETTGAYTLVGCTVAPGFDFADFEMADRDALTAAYPEHEALIARFTRG